MRVIGTTSLITAATFTVAVNATSYERWRFPGVPVSGIGCSTFAFGILVWMIWADPELGEGFIELVFATLTVGIGATYASLIQIPKLTSQFERARLISFLGDAALVVMTLVAIVSDEASGKLYAIVSIIVAAAALVVLIGTRSARSDKESMLANFCPACGKPVEQPDRCAACGSTFHVDFTTKPTPSDEIG